MRSSSNDMAEAIGTDSFLDVVANLVGILLILIMVIGARMNDESQQLRQSRERSASTLVQESSSVSRETEATDSNDPTVTEQEVAQAEGEVARLYTGTREAQREMASIDQLSQIRRMERDQLMVAITAAETELASRRAKLTSAQQESVELQRDLQRARTEYQSLIDEFHARSLDAETKAEVIQHFATPLAQTVFVREEHFRLKNGKLAYVPINEMTDQLRSEAPKKVWKLKNAPQVTETIGPNEGFSLRYTLRRNKIAASNASNGGMPSVREVVELDQFVMLPMPDLVEELAEDAMQEGSAFQNRLRRWEPKETVITIWTYADSHESFRKLKGWLFQSGFLTAARPLPDDQLISGSPEGTRSAAQ